MLFSNVARLLPVRAYLTQLENWFATAPGYYEELRQKCETCVARWQWASGGVYSLDPLFFLDRHLKVGRTALSPPGDPANWTAYGFTRGDRLIVERRYTELQNHSYYHAFYVELADRVVGYHYHHSPSHAIMSCSQLVFDNALPVCFQRWGERGWVSYTYSCSNERVDSFVCMAKEHGEDEPERKFTGEVRYKKDGVVELWEKEAGKKMAALLYRGKPPPANPFLRRL